MGESADFDESGAIAVSIGSTSLVGTGLAKETGGNLDTHTALLSGAQVGALVSGIGRTVAQEVAAMIATGTAGGTPGGTPVLHGSKQLLNVANQVVNPGANFTPANITFTRPSYAIRITAQMSAVNSVMPSVKVNLQWRSTGSGTAAVDQQLWYIPAGGSSQQRTNIKGPVLGDTLNITFTNGDAVNSVTLNINIYETSWSSVRHDGRSASNVGQAGATGINDDAGALVIGNDSFNVPANSTVVKTLALYAGQVNIWINQNVGAGSQVQINPSGDFTGGVSNPVASLDWTAPPHQIIGVILPRCWCTAAFINNAAAPVTATVGITALEYAS